MKPVWMCLGLRTLVCFCALIVSAMTGAASYLPLCIGNSWEYESPSFWERATVERTTPLWGTEVYVIGYDDAGPSGDTENFWTSEPEGDVYIWGFRVPSDNSGILYDPPIPMVDAPLDLGKTWSCVFDAYLLPDTTYLATLEITFEVLEEGLINVPAGTFYAFGIDYVMNGDPEVPALEGRSLAGYPQVWGANRQAKDWWCAGVGEVQYMGYGGQQFQLIAYELPTAAAVMSWGAIKAKYSGLETH